MEGYSVDEPNIEIIKKVEGEWILPDELSTAILIDDIYDECLDDKRTPPEPEPEVE